MGILTVLTKIEGGMAMPELRCGVITCAHNDQSLCRLDEIEVVGSSAKTTEQTSCGSFVEKKEENYSNSTKEPSPKSDIVCHACDCKYNDDLKCHAGEIYVAGSDACDCKETECSTFKKAN